ncbi:MAG TPA: histidine kinase [Glycomyces sp.]|nr:histidine kinase [Glycomyces sp.]
MHPWIKPAARWSAAAAALGAAAFDAAATGSAAAAPAAVAVAALAAGPGRRGRAPAVALTAAVSLAVTAGFGAAASNRAAAWWLLETAAVLCLIAAGSRTARTRFDGAALALAVAAAGLSPLRLGLRMDPPSDAAELAVLALLWAAAGAAAAAAGRWLHRLRRDRERAVAEARRSQRLSLARDLHDYVAHDVTGIVVQAQAAQVVGERDPAQALAALERIESAGLQALASLDRTVLLLREHEALLRDPGGGFADIVVLARRFEEGGGARTSVDIDAAAAGLPVTEAVGALAHRIVTEALTNVRRHAPEAADVRVRLRGLAGALAVEVANDVPAERPGGRPGGGLGLRQLAGSVREAGGTFDAGPAGPEGWRLSAVLPL